ncbi:hypothetical protein SLA2020_302420 [Shorea laevis]
MVTGNRKKSAGKSRESVAGREQVERGRVVRLVGKEREATAAAAMVGDKTGRNMRAEIAGDCDGRHWLKPFL